jgi:hypothetical protein
MLAYQVAQVLGVGQDQVLLHWACAKVTASSNTPDEQLKEAVSSKLSKATRPRFAAVAAHAQVGPLDAVKRLRHIIWHIMSANACTEPAHLSSFACCNRMGETYCPLVATARLKPCAAT